MAKEKQTRRMIAMALAAAVTMSSVPVVAFADVVDNGDGTSTKTETSTTESTTTSGPNTEGSDTKDAPTVTVTVTAHEKTDTTTSVTTDNATNETVSETVSKTDTDTTTEKTETSWKDESENKTVGFEGEKVETTVTETTMTTTTEGGETTTTTEDPDVVREHETNDETTTTVEKTENGTTTTVENVKTEDGTREDGAVVDSEVTTTTTTTTDAEGNVTETTTEDGEETIVTKEDVAVGDEDQPEVKVELKSENDTNPDDDKITVVGQATGEEVVELDETIEGENGDYTSEKVVSQIEKVVQATLAEGAGEVTVTENETDLEAMAPEDYEDKFFENNEGLMTGLSETEWTAYYEQLSPEEWKATFGFEKPERPSEEGYDYQWTGYGEATNAVRAVAMEVTYKKDPETGKAMVDPETGEYIVESIEYTGKYGDGMGSTPAIFALTKYDENGEPAGYYYGYCIDTDTEAMPGSWYQVSNLEDSDYYPDEASADKLRAVVNNGYWSQEEGKGSLTQMQANMEAYYAKNPDATVTIDDENGNPITYKVSELFAREDGKGKMNDADALAVTQAVIWSHANGTLAVKDGQDGAIIDGIYSVVKPKSNLANTDRDYDYVRDALLKVAYDWLMNVEPEEATDVVINEQNSIDDMTLVVGDKAVLDVDDTRNTDDDPDNDVYNTSVEFTLAFVPDKDDNIHVYVLDKDGNAMKDADGNVIERKLAAEGSEAEDGAISAENGVYTLDGLVFQENENVEFSLQLKGMQYLEEGVYIYQAYGGTDASQTMVGIASGEQTVDVSKSMTLEFNVDEEKKVTATSKWHKSSSKTTPKEPTTPPEGGGGGDNPGGGGGNPGGGDPGTNIPDEDVPLGDAPVVEGEDVMDIVDEDVPMAEVPLVEGDEEVSVIAQTGDSNHITAGFGGMFAALAGMFMLRKKKEN